MSISNADELNKFVVDAKTKMQSLETTSASTGERLATVETLAKQLTAKLDDIRRERDDDARHVATGKDADAVRMYFRKSGNTDELRAKGIAVADLRKGQAATKAVRHVGNDHGVVRVLGGVEGGRWEYGYLDDPRPVTEHQHQAQLRAEEIAWVKAIKGRNADVGALVRGLSDHMSRGPAPIARVFADNAGEGGEFIVSIPMAELERAAEIPRQVEGLFADMPVSAAQGTMPFQSTGVQPFIHNVPSSGDLNPAALPKSVPVTSDASYAVATMTLSLPADRDAVEDSIIDFIPYARQLVAEGDRDGTEDAIINGDTAATHGDTGFATWNPRGRWSVLGASNDHRRGGIGLRQRSFDVSSTSDYSATQTVSDYMGARALLGTAHMMGDVVYITSPEHYIAKILRDTNVLTVDKYGASASVLTGEVARIGGKPLIISDFMTSDLAATGLYTGSGTYTGMLVVNRARFKMLRLRSMRMEVATREETHTTYLVASSRKLFKTFDTSSTKNVAFLYKLSSS